LIEILDRYLDSAPRADANVVETGAFTLFVSRAPWPYYARPSIGFERALERSDVDLLADVCRQQAVPLAIEWICEVRPELAAVAAQCGLLVHTHPLLAAPSNAVSAAHVEGVTVRVASAEDPGLLAAGRAVADVSFGAGGTAIAASGVAERETAQDRLASAMIDGLRERAASGASVTAVAELEGYGIVGSGSYRPIADTAELLGVATLPFARRRGIAAALTAALARHAAASGVATLLLSAQDDDVARIYERTGFRRVGAAGAAERSS
jgi:ribosomal protein S18 acetylase RimI-like enzyme